MRTNEHRMKPLIIEWPNGTTSEYESVSQTARELEISNVTLWTALKRGYLYPKTKIFFSSENENER